MTETETATDRKTGLIPMTDLLYKMAESSALSREALSHFEGCDVVWAYWGPPGYPAGYEDDENPPLYARVIRGRDLDPTKAKSHGAFQVTSEIDALDEQEAIGDESEFTEDGSQYVEDDNVPAQWMRWLESVAADEALTRADKLRAYRASLVLNS